MKKTIISFCVLVLLTSASVFAESERKGTVIGTFGIGGGSSTTVQTESQLSFIFDLNLISKTGFTLCLIDIISVRFTVPFGASQHIMFGAGYHYMRDRWNIGGVFLASPLAADLLLAGKINGSYYFFDDIGITGTLIYRQSSGMSWDLSMFDAFVGVSIRLF